MPIWSGEALIREHPGDMQIHRLFMRLGFGLCFKVDRGAISISQATVIFENMRSALINAYWRRDAETDLEDYKKEMDGL